MNLRFAANLKWLFTELPFEQRFDAAAKAGFTGVEFPSPYEYDAGTVRHWLDAAGLSQVLINTPMGAASTAGRSGFACLPDQVDEFRSGVERGIEYAIALGSPFLHVVAGIRPDDVSRDRAFAQYLVNIQWAAALVQGTGVRILLEPQNKRDAPGFILESQAQAAAVIDAIASDDVRLLFDAYHVQVDEGDITSTFKAMLPRLGHMQIADPPSRTEPGTGELNWRTFFSSVADSGYGGWIGCEYRPSVDTLSSLGWMKELMGGRS